MPLFVYTRELQARFIFSFICICFCYMIMYWKSIIILTYLSYPLLSLNMYKRLIALDFIEIFSIYWTVTKISCFWFCFPYFIFQIQGFFKGAWYSYQIADCNCIWILWWFYFYNITILHKYLLPFLCNFFFYNEIDSTLHLLELKIEPNIINYIEWLLNIYFFTIGLILIILYLIFFFNTSKNQTIIFIKLRLYFYLIFLFIVLNIVFANLIVQIQLFFILLLWYEFFVLYSCL